MHDNKKNKDQKQVKDGEQHKGESPSDGPGQQYHGPLAGTVGNQVSAAGQSSVGGDVDDDSSALPTQHRHRCTAYIEHPVRYQAPLFPSHRK